MSAAGCINQRSLRGVPEWSLAYRALLPDRPVVTADNLKCNVKIKMSYKRLHKDIFKEDANLPKVLLAHHYSSHECPNVSGRGNNPVIDKDIDDDRLRIHSYRDGQKGFDSRNP